MSPCNEKRLGRTKAGSPPNWSDIFAGSLPQRIGAELRAALLLHGEQERRCKTAFRSVDRQLQLFLAASIKPSVRERRSATGSRLVRSWRGAHHEVMVVEKGFAYRGVVYRSLSEIARLVTGARWSGPRFFGLKDSK